MFHSRSKEQGTSKEGTDQVRRIHRANVQFHSFLSTSGGKGGEVSLGELGQAHSGPHGCSSELPQLNS